MSTGIFAELGRRNVIRMGGLYLIGAWLITQVAGTVLPMFDAPAWLPRSVVILLAIGFVPALVFAWIFELTPQGLKRDAELAPLESNTPHSHDTSFAAHTARRMDRLIIAALVVALLYFCIDKFVLAPRPTAPVTAPAIAKAVPVASGKSIAVLPFENLSAEQDNAYFATGMQDEILTRLAGIHDLKVISRTSTEQYASHPPNLKTVAQQLGVATVLEGSVQRAGGQVRINLQLIDAQSDSHLWAQNYDRDLKDVFAVQSDVAEKVADALQAQLQPAESERIASVPTTSLEAHDLFLQGQYLFHQLQTSSAKDPVAVGKVATDFYRRATAADPDFALAYARLSYLLCYLHWYAVDTAPDLVDAARAAAEKALALQPGLGEAHLAMGYVHYWGHRDYAAALDEFAQARASLPNNAEVIASIGYVHRRQGVPARGITELQQASVLDPRDSTIVRETANSYTALRRYAEADSVYAHSLAIFPDDTETRVQRAISAMLAGDIAAAGRMLSAIPADIDPQATVSLARFRLAMLQRQPDAALAAIAHASDWLMTRWEHSVVPISLLRGQALALKGDAQAARASFLEAEKPLQVELKNPVTETDALSYLGLVYAGLGRKEAALKAANAAVERMPTSRDVIVGVFYLERLARVEAQVGEAQSAINHLGQLLTMLVGGETVSVASLKIDPVWDPIRKDPRFPALIEAAATGDTAKATP